MPLARAAARRTVALDRPVTYVAMGASDAVGVGAANPTNDSWPAALTGMLPPGSRLIDLGVPSITLKRALDVELPVALDALSARCSAPAASAACGQGRGVVTVWLAVNDLRAGVALSAYAAELDTMLRALRAHANATVLVGNLPDLAAVPSFGGRGPAFNATVTAWNAAIAAVARREGARLVDLYSGWRELAAHPEYVGPDGLHPTAAGYRRLAELFYERLAR